MRKRRIRKIKMRKRDEKEGMRKRRMVKRG
jgi:hypothetical protein